MKRIFFLLSLLPFQAFATSLPWEWLSPRPTAERLLDVAVGQTEDKKELALVIGARGVLLASQDEGETWETRSTGVNTTLFDVAFIDQGKGYSLPFIVGDSGTILRGSYDGKTWTPLPSGTKVALRAIWGYDGTRIFAAGDKGTLLVSEDNGYSWKPIKTGLKTTLSGIITPSITEVYVVGTGNVLLYANDGGKKFSKKKNGIIWKDKDSPEESPKIWSTKESDLWVSGAGGALLFSSDQGKTWSSPPVSASAKSGCTRYLVSSKAELICSSDGISWGTLDAGKGYTPRSVAWLDPKRVYVVGDGGLLLRSLDQGKTWESKTKAERGLLNAFWGASTNDLYAVGNGGHIMHSSDAGKSWTVAQSNTTQNLVAVWGSGTDRVFAAGDNGTLLRSIDQGKTWTTLAITSKENLKAIWGHDTDVYVVGDKSTLLASFNGGENWVPLLDNTRINFRDIWGTSENDIFVVGAAGSTATILHSTDGSKTFTSLTFANPSSIDAIGGDGSKNVFGVSKRLLLKSPDGGSNWSTQITTLLSGTDEFSSDAIVSIWGDTKEIFIVTSSGTLFRSSNQGAKWTPEALPFGFQATKIFGIGSSLYVVGAAGSIEAIIKTNR